LVDVPISVTVPPTTAAKLTGMRYFDGERPARRAQLMTGGIAIATMGVLFRNAEEAAVGMRTRASVARSPDTASPARRAEKRATVFSRTRVRPAAAATT
jgi:hypothetical protein